MGKRKFHIFYYIGDIKHYVTQKQYSFNYSSDIERAREFITYAQVAKFVREQPEHIGQNLHCEEIG